MEVFHDAPVESSFIHLTEYQASTPQTFSGTVLHYKSTGRLLVLKEEASRNSAFENLVKNSDTYEDSWLAKDIQAWVSSEKFILWSPSRSLGVAIPYPSISLHALGSISMPEASSEKSQTLYLDVTIHDGFDDHAEEGSVVLNFVPDQTASAGNSEATSTSSPCQQLYDAVTDCANLHPDPQSLNASENGEDDGEDDGEEQPTWDYEVLDGDDMPAPFPGSNGWITSDNMHQYFDEDGNWRGSVLGPGAGIVRSRDEGNGSRVNGHTDGADDEDETKWRRTD